MAAMLDRDGKSVHSPIELRPFFARALGKRLQEQACHQRTAAKRIERRRLDETTCNAVDPMSGHIKTAKGCFDLRDDTTGDAVGLMGFEQRFWMSGCRDGRRDTPFRLLENE